MWIKKVLRSIYNLIQLQKTLTPLWIIGNNETKDVISPFFPDDWIYHHILFCYATNDEIGINSSLKSTTQTTSAKNVKILIIFE